VDWLEKAINALIEQPGADAEQPTQERTAGEAKSRFKFTAVGDILDDEPVEWAVRGLLAKNTVSLFFGKPSGGKGIAASSLAICIAAGLPFLGMEVAQMPTVYFAAERQWQVRRRIRGLRRKHGLPADTPCFIGGGSLDIRKESDAKELIREVRAIEKRTGAPVGFIVIDTFSRALAGGKENDTADMGRCRQEHRIDPRRD
jgi:RecA-family ATPase